MMLVNMIGIEDNQDVVDLDSRRSLVAVDPKSRVTLATLLQAALTSFPDADSVGPPSRVATPVATFNGADRDQTRDAPESSENAA